MNNHFARTLADAGIDPVTYRSGLEALASGAHSFTIVSGAMTAGKDTVAPHLPEVIPGPVHMLRYGDLMRAELDPGLDVLREMIPAGATELEMLTAIVDLMGLRREQATKLVQVLVPELIESGLTLTAHGRTNGIRTILQHIGSDWRCESDDDPYWARKAAHAALSIIGGGASVVLTGGRYLPDVEIPRATGAFLLRLDVTRETQLERLAGRDGLIPDADTLAALDHPGEHALDEYPHFSARVDNNGDLQDAIVASQDALAGHIDRLRNRAA